jgi:hypothetical protein
MLEETRPDTRKPTPFSLGFGSSHDQISEGVVCGDDHTILGALNMPKFLAKHDSTRIPSTCLNSTTTTT